jgi:hypothetical protein
MKTAIENTSDTSASTEAYIKQELEYIEGQKRALDATARMLVSLSNALSKWATHVSVLTCHIHMCFPTREAFRQFREETKFSGKWDRIVNGELLIYSTEREGITYVARLEELPPSCRVEEVEEVIPAQPERRVKVKRILCKEGNTSSNPTPNDSL